MNTLITAVEEWIDQRIARIADKKIQEAMSSFDGGIDWDKIDQRIEAEWDHQMEKFTIHGFEDEIESVVKEFIRDNVTVDINV